MTCPAYDYTPVTDPRALIQAEYQVRRPNGTIVRVNRFDFNLLWAGGKERYIQCSDMGWSKVGTLTVLKAAPMAPAQKAYDEATASARKA